MKANQFPYDKFLALKEEKDKAFLRFLQHTGKATDVPIVMRGSKINCFGALCRYRDKSLENQLDALEEYLHFKSDFMFGYLEPWHGVGVYAAAFGCPFMWQDNDAPQTLPIYQTGADLARLKKPDMHCEILNMVLDTIAYFRKETHGLLDIIATDTQSPIDNASLIMDACEFFAMSITEPEELEEFLDIITTATIEFTHAQRAAAGETFAGPGHLMLSGRGIPGMALSDDNLAVCSPLSYRNTAVPTNARIAKEFGGLGIHTCGGFTQNIPDLLSIPGLTMVDCAIGHSIDPTPNDPKKVRDGFIGSGKLLKVRLRHHELDKLKDIVHPDLKLVVELCNSGPYDEMIRFYEDAKALALSVLESY